MIQIVPRNLYYSADPRAVSANCAFSGELSLLHESLFDGLWVERGRSRLGASRFVR